MGEGSPPLSLLSAGSIFGNAEWLISIVKGLSANSGEQFFTFNELFVPSAVGTNLEPAYC